MNYFKNDILAIKKLQNEYIKKQKEVDKEVKSFNRKVEKIINKTMNDFGLIVHYSACFRGGCMTNSWHPQISVYGLDYFETNIMYYSPTKKWYKVSRNADDYSEKSVEEISPPFDMKKLKELIKLIKKETGVDTKLVGAFNYIIEPLIRKENE